MSAGMIGRKLVGSPPPAARLGQGPVVNIAADGLVECLDPPFRIDGSHSKQELIEAFEKTVDRYADAQVPYLLLNVCYQRAAYRSKVWNSYWDVDDPQNSITGWPRLYWLVHKKGVDPFEVCVARCRQRGISPWMSIRMNDTHYHDDPTRTSPLWQQHPELRRVSDTQWYCGFDYAQKRVRDHYLALVEELFHRYDCDGVELDWMRFPWHFKPGEERRGCEHLNQFMHQARQLAEAASAKRGRPVKIAARIPAVPEFALGLGMDGVTWARNGWVDMLILAPEWRPSDTDIPIERWRQKIGPAAKHVLLAAGTDLWLQGMPGGKLMSDDLETQRGFTATMLDRGADLVYLFNHFNRNDFRRKCRSPNGQITVCDESGELFKVAGRLQAAQQGPRRHVVTFHHPAAPNMPNPKQLPAELAPDRTAVFRIYTGPAPNDGRVIVRVGLDSRPAVFETTAAARLNGAECTPIADLAGPPAGQSSPHDRLRVFHVAHVAERMLQFEAPLQAMQRGYNRVDLSLQKGSPQRIIWLEIYIVPRRVS